MKSLRVAAVQFEAASGEKEQNFQKIEALALRAKAEGARVVSFHECSISGYTFARHLTKKELEAVAESVPDGPSTHRLAKFAARENIFILAGLFERDNDGNIYNSYLCVGPDGFVATHRKLHPFINPNLSAGKGYTFFEIDGWRCSILTCYDNNILENARATALLGAEILFMPHVTMCTPSTRPGAGFIDPELWEKRESDPTLLRAEFDGLKGRSWLMKWLPSRAYDNGLYAIFTNPIGMEDDQLKNGCSMILDPFGDILAECRHLGDDIVVSSLTREKLIEAGGHRYRNARKPELYGELLAAPHHSKQKVAWMGKEPI